MTLQCAARRGRDRHKVMEYPNEIVQTAGTIPALALSFRLAVPQAPCPSAIFGSGLPSELRPGDANDNSRRGATVRAKATSTSVRTPFNPTGDDYTFKSPAGICDPTRRTGVELLVGRLRDLEADHHPRFSGRSANAIALSLCLRFDEEAPCLRLFRTGLRAAGQHADGDNGHFDPSPAHRCALQLSLQRLTTRWFFRTLLRAVLAFYNFLAIFANPGRVCLCITAPQSERRPRPGRAAAPADRVRRAGPRRARPAQGGLSGATLSDRVQRVAASGCGPFACAGPGSRDSALTDFNKILSASCLAFGAEGP